MIGKAVGHYLITSKLGAGGMGEVFLAQDTRLKRKAATSSCLPNWPRTRDDAHTVLAELMEEHVLLKKSLGET